MGFTPMTFDPADGLRNRTQYPTTPVSEDEARSQIQTPMDQLKAGINALIGELENANTGTSGADNIGSAEIANVTGLTVRDQLINLKSQIDAISAGSVSDGTITTAKLAAGAVTGEKLAADAVDTGKIADGAVGEASIAAGAVTAGKLGDVSVVEANIGAGAVTETKIGTGAVTETKIGTGAVTRLKLNANALAIIPSLHNGLATIPPSGDNLNNYLSPGAYVFPVGTVANCPTYNCFKLIVDRVVGDASGSLIVQTLLDNASNLFRRYTDNGGYSWSSWGRTAHIVFGTSATPPSGLYPVGTLYVQHQA